MAAKGEVSADLREKGAVAVAGTVRLLRAVALPVAALAIYCAAAWGLWQYAAGHAARPIDARQCPWLTPADVAAINSGVDTASRSSLFERDICAQVARSYQGNPWVEQVVAVRRRFPDRVEVELAIRRPFASVHRGGLYYLVDHSGCRLPVVAAFRPDSRYPVIAGVGSVPPAAGEIWGDECLNDALRLAELLNEVLAGRGAAARLTLIDVKKPARAHDLRPQMIAQTAGGTEIDWGSFNETRTYTLPSVSDKRAELERQLRLIPDLAAVSCIRVRFRDGVIVPRQEPIAAGLIGMAP
jgi:hypothetical protein